MPTLSPLARLVTTDLNLLITPSEWRKLLPSLAEQLAAAGFAVIRIDAAEISLTCEPDNMLVNQFEQLEGHSPTAEVLHRVLIVGTTALSLVDTTAAVVQLLPTDTYWYGTTINGELDNQGVATCAWRN